MRVKDIMQRNPYRIAAITTAQDAAKIMEERMIGSLLIEQQGKVVGIMTEGDLVRKVLAKGIDGSEIYVNELKSFPLIKVDENTDVLDASLLLTKYTIRRLVVVHGEKIVGIISQAIIGKYLEELLEEANE